MPVRFRSQNFKFYVNGELRNDYSRIANRYDLNTNESLMIGSNQNGDNHNFKGKMDELRIYNKALTDLEIKTLYSNTSVQNVNASITIAKGSTEGTLEIKGVGYTSTVIQTVTLIIFCLLRKKIRVQEMLSNPYVY